MPPSQDDNDNIREGRITMKPTIEQKALIAASKPGIDLLLEELKTYGTAMSFPIAFPGFSPSLF